MKGETKMRLILVLTALILIGLTIGKMKEDKKIKHYQHPTCTMVYQIDRGPMGLGKQKTRCTTQIVMRTL